VDRIKISTADRAWLRSLCEEVNRDLLLKHGLVSFDPRALHIDNGWTITPKGRSALRCQRKAQERRKPR
jgi:hypothetical protein